MVIAVVILAITASQAMLACPKGQHPHGVMGTHCSYEK